MMGPGGVRKTTQESLKQEKSLKYTQVDAGRQTLKNCVFQSFFSSTYAWRKIKLIYSFAGSYFTITNSIWLGFKQT